jgi:MOSC domain-containing protein YiiM
MISGDIISRNITPQPPRLLSVNVGGAREFLFQGKRAASSIWKRPITGPVAAGGVNLAGDDQADREAHGGADKAVYAYAIEDVRFWEQELGRAIELSAFGENLTTAGLDLSAAIIGERWEIGSALFEVSQPRVPCWKLGVKMEDPGFPKRFMKAGRPGAYLRIAREGMLASSDLIAVTHRPGHGVTVSDVFRIYARERDKAGTLLEVPELSEDWKEWARRQLTRA